MTIECEVWSDRISQGRILAMGVMILPLVLVLVAGLLVLGLVCAERFPVRSWPSRIGGLVRNAQEVRQEGRGVEVEVVPQEVRLTDLMTREGPAAYVGTDSFGGLAGVVEKAMDGVERTRGVAGSRRRGHVHEPAAGGLSQTQG
jgi:hypothetical protein avisC_00822